MAVKIFSAARERLLQIWDYTDSTWGTQQADKYLRELVASCQALATRRSSWRHVKFGRLKGVYCFHHEHHYIFFRELSVGTIGIVSILHENMDLPNRLKDDLKVPEDQ